MKFAFGVCLCLAAIIALATAQRGNFRQRNNRFNNVRPNNNFRQRNNVRPQNNFRPQNRVRQFQPQRQQQNSQPLRFTQVGLDTSDGRFERFNGPVRGLPPGHGGGRFGAANCLLCPNGF